MQKMGLAEGRHKELRRDGKSLLGGQEGTERKIDGLVRHSDRRTRVGPGARKLKEERRRRLGLSATVEVASCSESLL